MSANLRGSGRTAAVEGAGEARQRVADAEERVHRVRAGLAGCAEAGLVGLLALLAEVRQSTHGCSRGAGVDASAAAGVAAVDVGLVAAIVAFEARLGRVDAGHAGRSVEAAIADALHLTLPSAEVEVLHVAGLLGDAVDDVAAVQRPAAGAALAHDLVGRGLDCLAVAGALAVGREGAVVAGIAVEAEAVLVDAVGAAAVGDVGLEARAGIVEERPGGGVAALERAELQRLGGVDRAERGGLAPVQARVDGSLR